MDKAYLVIQGTLLGMESDNLIYRLNIDLSRAMRERNVAKSFSHSCLGEQEGWNLCLV